MSVDTNIQLIEKAVSLADEISDESDDEHYIDEVARLVKESELDELYELVKEMSRKVNK